MSEVGFGWDVYQQYQIHKLNKTADGVKDIVAQDIAGVQASVGQLEEKLDRLALICRAMYELLQETSGVSDEQLSAKITEVDLRDGKADGRVTPQQKPCPECDAMICARFNRCLFCGYKDESGDVFDTL